MTFRSLPACLLVTVFVSASYSPAQLPSTVGSVSISWGAFRTPSQSNIALPGPCRNDGSLKTLKEGFDFYFKGGSPKPTLSSQSPLLSFLAHRGRNNLGALMETLTREFPINCGAHILDNCFVLVAEKGSSI